VSKVRERKRYGDPPKLQSCLNMCGRSTYKLTWEEIVRLYKLTLDVAPHNFRPRHNVCPTTPIDAVIYSEGKRSLERMRWGLIPNWWSKPLKELTTKAEHAHPSRRCPKILFDG
jgi:putative SOS response-associated peptidase YedK